jgi:UDP-N-acetylglucosamine 2-epimerase
MKLGIIVGTRPEIIRLSSTIKLAVKLFNSTLIHTGQNYDYNLNEVFFKDLDLPNPDIYLNCSVNNLGETVGDIISKSYNLFLKNKFDAILILGDTNSCLCAYSAKRLKIPIFHLEAGNRCFDPNVPEELNRKIIDHLADVNVCYIEQARRNLLSEGIKTQYTFVAGSPMPEVILSIKDKINNSTILNKLNIEKNNYFVWSSHREENINLDNNFDKVINSINNLASKYNKTVIFSCHPRTKKKIKNIKLNENIVVLEPLGLIDYCSLQENSLCTLSDSGTVSEESTILNFKAILLRTSTEHPENIDAGNITLGNIDWQYLDNALDITLNNNFKLNNIINYNDNNFSEKVCKIISGYYGVINKFVWMK